MSQHEGYRDRLIGGCPDCGAYTEVVTPIGQETTITVFHDATCPATEEQWIAGDEGHNVGHAVKPEVLPDWPEQ